MKSFSQHVQIHNAPATRVLCLTVVKPRPSIPYYLLLILLQLLLSNPIHRSWALLTETPPLVKTKTMQAHLSAPATKRLRRELIPNQLPYHLLTFSASTKVQPGDSNTDTQSEHVATSTTKTKTPVPPPRCPYLQHLDLIRMGAQFGEEK
jgi:hypothetical protein